MRGGRCANGDKSEAGAYNDVVQQEGNDAVLGASFGWLAVNYAI